MFVCVCFVMQNASISMSVAQILLGQNFRFWGFLVITYASETRLLPWHTHTNCISSALHNYCIGVPVCRKNKNCRKFETYLVCRNAVWVCRICKKLPLNRFKHTLFIWFTEPTNSCNCRYIYMSHAVVFRMVQIFSRKYFIKIS